MANNTTETALWCVLHYILNSQSSVVHVVHVAREAVVVLVILVEVEATLRNTGGVVGWVDERHDLEFGREVLGVRSGCDRRGCERRR